MISPKYNTYKIVIFFLLFYQFTAAQTAPIALDDSYATKTNLELRINTPGLLSNDTDKDDDELEVIRFSVSGSTYNVGNSISLPEGTITINANGSFVFIPTINYNDFTIVVNYTISDGTFTASANLTIKIINLYPPKAQNDNYTTETNAALNIDAPGILNNDTDKDENFLTITEFKIDSVSYKVGEKAKFNEGSITINANGSFSFIPTKDYNKSIPTINYTVSDGTFTSTANLTIKIINLYPPTVQNDNYTTETNAALNIDAPGILNNDTDKDKNFLTITEFKIDSVSYKVGEKAKFNEGSITLNANGSFSFTPATDYNNSIPTINYTVSDGTFTSTANLTIKIINLYPPDAKDDYDTANINTTLSVHNPGVLINDSDQDNNALSIINFIVNGKTYNTDQTATFTEGSISFKPDGSYSFIPAKNYTGNVPVIKYIISDGTFTDAANLYLTVEHITNLLKIKSLSSCNQGYTVDGVYKIKYNITLKNTSTARDYHAENLITNINLTNDLNAIYGNTCVEKIEGVTVSTTSVQDFVNNPYPLDFDNDAINNDFFTASSNEIFNKNAIDNFTLYPRQSINIQFCVTVNPFCNGRPNPTPSGSGIDFNHVVDVTSTIGNDTANVLLTDFHTTEAILAGGLYVPEPKPKVNPDGTFDYTNRVILTNEGTATANNINYNMGLGDFLNKSIVFKELKVTQISGPNVTVNNSYNGDTNTKLLMPNNTLAPGETVILEIFYLTEPFSSSRVNNFYQLNRSQTQGGIDGFDETTTSSNKSYSFVNWSDNLGNHLDRYYPSNSPTAPVSSSLQCSCSASSMVFLFNSFSGNTKTISEVNKVPNGILEHQEITFQLTVKNTSEIVQLENLNLQDDLNKICVGNIVSVSLPFIENSTATTNPTLNPAYNGVSDINFFDGTSGILMQGETITVQFTVVFYEDCINPNTSSFTATDPLNVIISSSAFVLVNASTDTDNDGITNFVDIDDDNDTILDIDEYNGLNPLDDHDKDLTPNYRDTDYGVDANNDGIVDIFDFDNDGVPNHFDLDSDNDGILDIVEAGNRAADKDQSGTTNNFVGNNGLDNTLENTDTASTSIKYTILNTDANGSPNFIDIDADADGIVDNIEGQTTATYKAPNGIVNTFGIDTAYPNGITPTDTDRDGDPDYIDLNSDNDIRDDAIEAWDDDNDGVAETNPLNLDSDNDGLDDAYDNNKILVNPTNNQDPTDFPNNDDPDTTERDWREIIAIDVLIDNVSAIEGKVLEFTILLVKKTDHSKLIQSASPITISFTTEDGTETANKYNIAIAPYDYEQVTSKMLKIPAFTDTKTFTITSLDDNIDELEELFTLNGKIISNNTINTEISGVGTILDDDDAPSISMNDSENKEGEDLEHTIKLSHPSSRPIYIDIHTTDGTAISPEDYPSSYKSVSINETTDPENANTETTFNISTYVDNINEPDEFINVLGVVASSPIGTQDLTKTGTILDINQEPQIIIDDVTVIEGATLVFTISLINPDSDEPMQNSLPINFNLQSVNETASDLEDFKMLFTNATIPAFSTSITQKIQTIDDSLNEDTETMRLQVSITSTDVSNISSTIFGTGTIKDNDYPNLFSPNGDGKSDTFEIAGIEEYPNFKIIIMDRWGGQVFNYNNNGKSNPLWWDGCNHGKPVTEGIYYYSLNYNDGITKPKKSFIQLIR
ncbi:cadherin-like domain-containing protein [Polaribacter sp. Q13]|uniref:cadherin-like domain-containing protein n=1 Tax=Polaribacter sp. Q13 TaxID=2806551 RepID=UPI00193B1A43|nr:cadherin-like domain-containing protein [Polaribacter sp. Q13]QVY65218.1 cadherin-like domain-containing protein [Polaribacter sp. Q13]